MVIGGTCINVTWGGEGGRGVRNYYYMAPLEQETSCDHILYLLKHFSTLLYLVHVFSDHNDEDDILFFWYG